MKIKRSLLPGLVLACWCFCCCTGSVWGKSQLPGAVKTYLVRGDRYYPPFEFINEKGKPDGFNVDLFKAIAAELDLSYKLELGLWAQVREELESGEIDALLGVMYSDDRSQKMDFSVPHSIVTHGVFTRENSPLETLEDLQGKAIIVQLGDRMYDYLQETRLTDKIIPVADQLEALRMLSNGRYDAALLGNFQGTYLIKKHGISNVVLKSSGIEPQKYAIAVSKNNEELLALINLGLFRIKGNGTYDKLYEKWFGVYEKADFWKRNSLFLAGAGGLIAVLLGFVLLVRVQVRSRTKDLKEQKQFLETLINTMPNPVYYKDAAGTYLGCNQAFLEITGRTTEEVAGNTSGAVGPPEFVRVFQEKDRELLANPGKQQFEFFVQNARTGVIRDVIFHKATFRNSAGQLAGIIGVMFDITERKKADRELELYRSNLEKLVNERTAELEEKNRELEKMNNLFVGREFRIKELRDKIRQLEEQIAGPERPDSRAGW